MGLGPPCQRRHAAHSSGNRVTSKQLPAANTIDADMTRGIVLLVSGRDIVHVKWDGTEVRRFRLPEEIFDLAWTDGNAIAVTPRWADHRVEIWDLSRMQG